MSDSLAEAYPKEQARVRECLEHYEDIQRQFGRRVSCHFAIAMIKSSLAAAERAAAEQDVAAMVRCLVDLRSIE